MEIVCLDLEGVLVPEIWIAFAEETGIPELKKTTRDEPDCEEASGFLFVRVPKNGTHRLPSHGPVPPMSIPTT